MVKRGLGKGLQALIPTINEEEVEKNKVIEIKTNQIIPNQFQPRIFFDEEKLQELADSIKEHGIVQPIIVTKKGKNKYELVAGERRWRAAQKIGLEVIPAIVKEYNDREMSEIALIENIQREDLNPIEEAQAYKILMDEFELTQEQLSKKIGKSRPFIANVVRLLKLSPIIQEYISKEILSVGHARTLLSLENKEKQLKIADQIIKNNLTVRETEELLKNINNKQKSKEQKTKPGKNEIIFVQIEEKLRELLGTQVKVKSAGKKGKIEIEYYSEEDLERIIEALLNKEEF